MLPIILAFTAMFGWAMADTLSVVLYRRYSSGVVTVNVAIGRMLVWLCLLPWFYTNIKQVTLYPLAVNLFAGLCSGVGLYFYGKALKSANPVLVTPITCSSVSTLIFAKLLFNESISIFQSISLVIVLAGYVISVAQPGAFKKSLTSETKGLIYAFVTFITWGVCGAIIKIPSLAYGWFWSSVFLLVPYSIVVMLDRQSLRSKTSPQNMRPFFIFTMVILLSAAADFGMFGGYTFGGKGLIVGTIGQSFPVLSTLLMCFGYREPLNKQQLIGTITSVIGIVLTAITSLV